MVKPTVGFSSVVVMNPARLSSSVPRSKLRIVCAQEGHGRLVVRFAKISHPPPAINWRVYRSEVEN